MRLFSRQTKQETIIYTIVWSILFLSPLVSLLFNHDDASTDKAWVWHSLAESWVTLLAFLIVFLIHNHVVAPILVKHKRIKSYLIACVALVTVFQLAECAHRPNGAPLISPAQNEMPPPRPPMGHPPVDKHDISVFFIIIMMIGANLGVKAYFQSEEEKKRLAKLREQSLKQELDYLRYQVNPHFIMNMLNNIHALVDIDPDVDYSFHSDLRLHVLRQHAQLYSS